VRPFEKLKKDVLHSDCLLVDEEPAIVVHLLRRTSALSLSLSLIRPIRKVGGKEP